MRKTAKQQVEEIEMARFEIYMTLFLLNLGIELSIEFVNHRQKLKSEVRSVLC